ncbi:MAG: c-type cytochrome [Pseudomonadota bacterium]
MKDPLFGNKLAAAGLITILLAFGLPIIINTLGTVFGGHHGHHGHDEGNPFGLAYIPAEIKLEGAAAAPPKPKLDLGTLLASASVDRGRKAAALCGACHTFDEGGANGIGPNLWNVVGREKGNVSGFGYSAALLAFGGSWSYEELNAYLENSSAFMPGTQMAQMVRKENKRADLLAYMASLSSEPVPFPAPAPPAEEHSEADHGEDGAEAAGH